MHLFDGVAALFHCLEESLATSRPNRFPGAALHAVLSCGPVQSSLITSSNVNRNIMSAAHSRRRKRSGRKSDEDDYFEIILYNKSAIVIITYTLLLLLLLI